MVELTDFSDDILLHVFSYLSPSDLVNIVESCDRFINVAKDHTLWKTADFSDTRLTATQILRKAIPCFHSSTKEIYLTGNKTKFLNQSNEKWKSHLLSPLVLRKIGLKCKNLKHFCINEAFVNAQKIRFSDFIEIKTIESLSICNCEFYNLPSPITEGSYFKNMGTFLPNLIRLEISNCNWMTDYDLMVLSKLETLKKLILKCNLRIGFTIAYLSICFRFGFKNLEELDMRGTSLQNSELQSIVQNGKLKKLLIGPIDKVKRVKEAVNGYSLLMSDPRRAVEDPEQQVVIINITPEGPNWRHADVNDLDRYGLDWVMNGINKKKENEDKDKHYFIDETGNIIQPEHDGECSHSNNKRKSTDVEIHSAAKRRRRNEFKTNKSEDGVLKYPAKIRSSCSTSTAADVAVVGSSESMIKNSSPIDISASSQPLLEFSYSSEESGSSGSSSPSHSSIDALEPIISNLPDENLSDAMIHAFAYHGKNLEHLTVAGCAISDVGLRELVSKIPALKYLDVTFTNVTIDGIRQAQSISPDCVFVSHFQNS